MFKAKIENTKNEILTLTQDEQNFQIISITGLNPPSAKINISSMANLDGAKYNSSKLETRNIVIKLKINGDIENNRQLLYKYFPTKEWCKFYFKNENRDVYIEGYVENIECDLFTNDEIMQISIICPEPYFKAIDEIIDDISKVISAFEFPFAFGSNGATNPDIPIDTDTDNAIPFSTLDSNKITNVYNDSETETGFIIEIGVSDTITNIKLVNIKTGETFTIDDNFLQNDKIIIDTNKGKKSAKLIRNGVTSNLFSSIIKGSKFFQLSIGDNFFSYIIDDGVNDDEVHILFRHNTIYRGV